MREWVLMIGVLRVVIYLTENHPKRSPISTSSSSSLGGGGAAFFYSGFFFSSFLSAGAEVVAAGADEALAPEAPKLKKELISFPDKALANNFGQ